MTRFGLRIHYPRSGLLLTGVWGVLGLRSASNTLATLDARMLALGYPTNDLSPNTATPAGVGQAVYETVSAWFINDGARQTNGTPQAPYPDYPPGQGGYVYVNPPLPAAKPGIAVNDVNRWQRLQIVNAADQNGFPQGPIQNYLGAQWLGVRPFALARTDATQPWIDPGPPPQLGTASDAEFRSSVVAVIHASSELTPDDGVTMDICPGALGNSSLGTNDGQGHTHTPMTLAIRPLTASQCEVRFIPFAACSTSCNRRPRWTRPSPMSRADSSRPSTRQWCAPTGAALRNYGDQPPRYYRADTPDPIATNEWMAPILAPAFGAGKTFAPPCRVIQTTAVTAEQNARRASGSRPSG